MHQKVCCLSGVLTKVNLIVELLLISSLLMWKWLVLLRVPQLIMLRLVYAEGKYCSLSLPHPLTMQIKTKIPSYLSQSCHRLENT